MSEWFTADDIRRDLRERTQEWGGGIKLAKQCRVSRALLSQIMSGSRNTRAINPKVLKALGYDARPFYRKIAK